MFDADKPCIRVVGALAMREGRILLTQRPAGRKFAGMWEFPGGKVQPGETDQAALVREIHEELGIHISVGPLYQQIRHEYDHCVIELYMYPCDAGDAEPQCLEVAAIQWILPSFLLQLPLTAADIPVAERICADARVFHSDGLNSVHFSLTLMQNQS